MPRASINLEFKDDDLRKFAEDALRRWTLNTIHDLLKHLRDPHLSQLVQQVFHMGVDAAARTSQRRRAHPQYEDDIASEHEVREVRPGPHRRPFFDVEEFFSKGPWPSPPRPPDTQEMKRCVHVEANLYQEEGWICHACSIYNGMQRSVCRQCAHERCDDVVPVAPSSGGDNVPSGSV